MESINRNNIMYLPIKLRTCITKYSMIAITVNISMLLVRSENYKNNSICLRFFLIIRVKLVLLKETRDKNAKFSF